MQIFGTKKSKDTRKAERFFKERRIKYHFVDLKERGLSPREFDSIKKYVGGIENMIDWDHRDKDGLAHLKYLVDHQKEEYLLDHPELMKMPIVREKNIAIIGHNEDKWKELINK